MAIKIRAGRGERKVWEKNLSEKLDCLILESSCSFFPFDHLNSQNDMSLFIHAKLLQLH